MIRASEVEHIEGLLRSIARERSANETLAPLVEELLARMAPTELQEGIEGRRRRLMDAIGLLAVLAIEGDRKNLDHSLLELSELCGVPLNMVGIVLPGAEREVVLSSYLSSRSEVDARFISIVQEALRDS
jgi:hypothetical protein